MFPKLFNIAVVVFLAIISMALIAFLLTGPFSMLHSPVLSGGYGVTMVSGGISAKLFNFLVVVGSLLVAGVFLLWRRRKLR